jgi:hypothetical protein
MNFRTIIALNPQNIEFNIYTGLTMSATTNLIATNVTQELEFQFTESDLNGQDYYYLKFTSEVSKPVYSKVQINPVDCPDTICVEISGDDVVFNYIYIVSGSTNGKKIFTSLNPISPSFQTIYWSITNNRWEISEFVDSVSPTAFLTYNGDYPLSGQLPNNEQWSDSIVYSDFECQ